jgi:hypothetical protein
MITWHINLDGLKVGQHRVETHEGSIRVGKITRINMRETSVLGKIVRTPVSLEMGDPMDFIAWETIRTIEHVPSV